MTDRIRVAVAGLGAVAQAVHLPLLARRWDLFEVAAVSDLSAGLRDALRLTLEERRGSECEANLGAAGRRTAGHTCLPASW